MRKTRIFAVMALILLLSAGCGRQEEQVVTTENTDVLETGLPDLAEETIEEGIPTVPTAEPESEPVAQEISQGVRVLVDGADHSSQLADGKHLTKRNIAPEQVLSVESEEAFSGIYMQWDRLPGIYTLWWENGSMECGGENFLHDYIRLPEPVNRIEFRFAGEEKQLLCDLQVFTFGTAPEGVQDWQEPCETADILVFPTHADDDVFFFGPVIAYYAIERDLTVQTAFMVDHVKQPERAHERLNGLWELGVRNYPILGDAPDTGVGTLEFGLTFYADSDIYSWQMEQIRRFKPLVILGHDLEGEYGNKGHKVNAYYLTQTVVDAADPEKDPESAQKFGVWDTPKLYLHLYEENSWLFDGNAVMEKDPEGRTPLQVANVALDCHVSQNGVGMHVYQDDYLPEWDCRPFGLYRTLVGYDTGADVMENIAAEDWR